MPKNVVTTYNLGTQLEQNIPVANHGLKTYPSSKSCKTAYTGNLTKTDIGYGVSTSSFFNYGASPGSNLSQHVHISLGQLLFKRL